MKKKVHSSILGCALVILAGFTHAACGRLSLEARDAGLEILA